jgi:hypothetical protein
VKRILKYVALALVLLMAPVRLDAMEKNEKKKTEELIKKAKLELEQETKEKEQAQTQRLMFVFELLFYNKDLSDEQKLSLMERSLKTKPNNFYELARGIMDDATLDKDKKAKLLKNLLSLDWIKKNANLLFGNTWLDGVRFLWQLGYLTQTREALEKGKFVTKLTLKLSNGSKITPMHIAAAMGKVKEIQYFRQRGCNTNYTVKIPTKDDEYGCLTAADIAALHGRVRTTSYLLRHEGKSNKDSDMISVITAFHKLLATKLTFDGFINSYLTISKEAVANTGVPGKAEDLNKNIACVKKLLYLDKNQKIANAFNDWDKKRTNILNTVVNALSSVGETKNMQPKDAQLKAPTSILNNNTILNNTNLLTKTLNIINPMSLLHTNKKDPLKDPKKAIESKPKNPENNDKN